MKAKLLLKPKVPSWLAVLAPPHPEACFESTLTLKQRLFAFEVELNSFQLRQMAVLWVQVGVAVGPRM